MYLSTDRAQCMVATMLGNKLWGNFCSAGWFLGRWTGKTNLQRKHMIEGASGALQSSWLLGSGHIESPNMQMLQPLSSLIPVFDHPLHSKKFVSISSWNFPSSSLYLPCHLPIVHSWVKSGFICSVLSHEAATGRKQIPPKISLQRLYENCFLTLSMGAMCFRPPDHQGRHAPRCQKFWISTITSSIIYFNIFSEHTIWKLCLPNKFSLPRKTNF